MVCGRLVALNTSGLDDTQIKQQAIKMQHGSKLIWAVGKFWLHGFFSTTAQNLFDRPDSLKCGRTSNHVCNRLMSAPLFLFLSLIATNWTVLDAAISATVRFAFAEIQRLETSLSCWLFNQVLLLLFGWNLGSLISRLDLITSLLDSQWPSFFCYGAKRGKCWLNKIL